jgi:hypothetical protein
MENNEVPVPRLVSERDLMLEELIRQVESEGIKTVVFESTAMARKLQLAFYAWRAKLPKGSLRDRAERVSLRMSRTEPTVRFKSQSYDLDQAIKTAVEGVSQSA